MPDTSAIRIAVGSLRAPKLNAVRAALEACGAWLAPGREFEVIGFDVPSGVSATPISRTETMQGARSRAESLRATAHNDGVPFQFYVGLEGGLEVLLLDGERRVFLESWVYVAGDDGRGHYGQSGAVAIPPELASRVLDDGIDLSDAIDAYAGARGIRNGMGAWGVLTCGLITREDAFRIAAINAFSPFFKQRSAATSTL
jgi:non-canonical (house-cleaning) NTP pyrophosphatase